MDLHEIVMKLNGPIKPIGKTEVDDIRYNNLDSLIQLINELITDVEDVI